MGIRVSYGDRSGIPTAIEKGVIPQDSFIIGTYGDNEAELMFYDKHKDIRHLVAQTEFDDKDKAIAYAISHSKVGNTITILEGGVYTAYVVQPDFSLRELGMGKFRPETIEELLNWQERVDGKIDKLEEDVSGLGDAVDGLRRDTRSLMDKVEELDGKAIGLREDVDALKEDTAELKNSARETADKVGTLEGDVATIGDDVGDLKRSSSKAESDIEALQSVAHTHENKELLDSITEERITKWDTGVTDTESLPVATDESKGTVRSTERKNGVSVAEDGTMEVNSLSVGKLEQDADSVIVIRCGSATE